MTQKVWAVEVMDHGLKTKGTFATEREAEAYFAYLFSESWLVGSVEEREGEVTHVWTGEEAVPLHVDKTDW